MMLHGYMHLPAATSQILTSLSTLALASIFLFEKKNAKGRQGIITSIYIQMKRPNREQMATCTPCDCLFCIWLMSNKEQVIENW
jgi:hypothetical protein